MTCQKEPYPRKPSSEALMAIDDQLNTLELQTRGECQGWIIRARNYLAHAITAAEQTPDQPANV